MPWTEREKWAVGDAAASYYRETLQRAATRAEHDRTRRKIIKPREMPWELSPHGLIKHMVDERMNARVETVDIWMHILLPGSRSGKHRHMTEEGAYVLEGRGYDLHWDGDFEIGDAYRYVEAAEPRRFEWKAGDVIYIPPCTTHQHVNLDPERPARLIFAQNRIYRWSGLDDLVQIENAPEYDGKRTIDELLGRLQAASRA